MVVYSLEKFKAINPSAFLLMATLFFIPISPSLKSIFVILSLISILSTTIDKEKMTLLWAEHACRSAVLFFSVIVLGCLWGASEMSIKLHLIEKNIKLLFLPILALGFMSRTARVLGLYAFLMSMSFVGILSFFKAYGYDFVPPSDPSYIGDAGAIFHNHIITGFMMSLAAYFSAVMATQQSGRKVYFFNMLAIFFSAQILFVNTGKMGLMVYVSLLLTYLMQVLNKKQIILGIIGVCALLVLLMSQSNAIKNTAQEIITDYQHFQQGEIDGSLGLRIQFHRFAKDLFIDSPFIGQGTGGFRQQFELQDPVPEWKHPYLPDPHSQYWLVASELGLIGLLSLFYFLFSLFKCAFKLNEMKPILLGLMIAFLLGNASDSLLLYSAVGYLFILLAALSLGERLQMLASTRQTRVV